MADRNVQKLQPITLVPTRPQNLHISTREFWQGWQEALFNQQSRPRFNLDTNPTEYGIVEIVMNLCELYADGELTKETLQHDCGLIAGWVYRLAVVVE